MRTFFVSIILFLVSCNSSNPIESSSKVPSADQSAKSTRRLAKDILDLKKFAWVPLGASENNFSMHLDFSDEYVAYYFDTECAYLFFTNTTYATSMQQTQLVWTYHGDCKYDYSFLFRSHNVKHHPRYGDVFAIYKLQNDTILDVEYKFPEWVARVNQIAKDSVFPKKLHLIMPGGI